jgi:hypothetical protein
MECKCTAIDSSKVLGEGFNYLQSSISGLLCWLEHSANASVEIGSPFGEKLEGATQHSCMAVVTARMVNTCNDTFVGYIRRRLHERQRVHVGAEEHSRISDRWFPVAVDLENQAMPATNRFMNELDMRVI